MRLEPYPYNLHPTWETALTYLGDSAHTAPGQGRDGDLFGTGALAGHCGGPGHGSPEAARSTTRIAIFSTSATDRLTFKRKLSLQNAPFRASQIAQAQSFLPQKGSFE
ncbi:MAG: hypothetical protein ACR2KT_03865 [Methylocella sp.]|nr:MAG: hypothetical protein DLM68_10845 [Hyphomicrobiales bacterium]